MDTRQLLAEASNHHRSGRVKEARELYERVLRIDPGNVDALGLYGMLAHQVGHYDAAVSLFRQAAGYAPRSPDAHLNLGSALRATGRLEEAVAETRVAISLRPNHAASHHNLGLMLLQQEHLDEAEATFRKAIALDPGRADPYDGLGLVAQRRGRFDEAVEHHRTAVEREPSFAEAHRNLGAALIAGGYAEEAIASLRQAVSLAPGDFMGLIQLANALRDHGNPGDSLPVYRHALEIAPDSAPTHVDHGVARQELGDAGGALESYDRALSLHADYPEALRNRAIAFLSLGRHEEAHGAFQSLLHARHGGAWWNAPRFDPSLAGSTRPLRCSTYRLQDAAEQIDLLVARGKIDPSFEEMARRYRTVREEIAATVGEDGTVNLSRDQCMRIGGFLDRVVRYADAPRIAGGAINPDVDYAALEESYLSSPISVTTFDDFLTPAALASLRDFCLENTIFFKYSEARFVGSDLSSGFTCSLLYQMAEELKQRFPRILSEHALTNVWIYRHRAESVGVEAHSDQGKVTFNFWISPDDANLNPDHGGLVVYVREQPYDWDWTLFNRYKYRPDVLARINSFLESAETMTIPHRQNRALLFNSNLFHKSDDLHFRDEFESRRMNVTMLFGKRGPG